MVAGPCNLKQVDLAIVKAEAAKILDGHDVAWSVRQLVGDPAMAMKHLAEQVDAALGATDPRATVIGEDTKLAVRLVARTTLPAAILRHRLGLLAGAHWQLRDVRF